MYIHAHAAFGWILAQVVGRGDARFRRAVFLSAIAPDFDAMAYLLGLSISLDQHHVWTHNLLFSWALSLAAMLYCPNMKMRILLLTQLAFYAHYFGDYFFTTWPLCFLYPFSPRPFLSAHAFHLWHPVNQWLGAVLAAVALMLCFVCRRTPLELVSPALDRAVVRGLGARLASLRSFMNRGRRRPDPPPQPGSGERTNRRRSIERKESKG
ncbi:MAG TPA: metal-dependent hydrolase [Kiritimatiellia bacterium]|nr:metal-dependent hydrolase [Kiritimatiellia bacterium]HSA19484.1 metal-dependent hydrolase [Kiritimatiellia bacterium]